ncbi:unnamed protein product [Rhodiola kirilowii]
MCIETTSFSIQINGEMVDNFEGKRGLRQGDPMSPLLFTVAMEYLSRLLKGLTKAAGFYHHPKCHRVDLKHIIFADGLFLFSNGRCSSIAALKGVLDEFLQCSGLSVNIEKSQLFVAGMNGAKRSWVENLLCTKMSVLPVRYLGFPLTAKSIIQRLTSKLGSWCNRFLSRAGRRVFIQSVLQAVVFYWARICVLPRKLWDLNKEGHNLWTQWLKAYWTKGINWWENGVNSSWVLKRLAACKQMSEKCIIFENGSLRWIGEGGQGFTVRDTFRTLKTRPEEVRLV